MIFLTNNYNFDNKYWPFDFDAEDTIIFDIETTGFSALSCNIYLIGAIYFEKNSFYISQWFADETDDEKDVLSAFLDKAYNYRNIMHFNGTTFDIPFIKKRCDKLHIEEKINELNSVDIYKMVQKFRKPLNLGSTKQKVIESFLGIDREDKYNGGQLIEIYKQYLKDKDEEKYKLLILHNYEDMLGMPEILNIFKFDKIKDTSPLDISAEASPDGYFVLTALYDVVFPAEFSHRGDGFYLVCHKNKIKVKIDITIGVMKHFFENYRDYFYLPLEDMAIHKSVAIYVDKNFRTKATKDNCYVRKESSFIPCFSPHNHEVFKHQPDGEKYMEYNDELLNDEVFLKDYYFTIINELFKR